MDVFDVLLVLLAGHFVGQGGNFRHPDLISTPGLTSDFPGLFNYFDNILKSVM